MKEARVATRKMEFELYERKDIEGGKIEIRIRKRDGQLYTREWTGLAF